MSINIGTLDIGVAFAGDTSGLQKATADAQQGIDRFGASTSKAMRQVREDTQGAEDALDRLSQGFKGAVIGSSVAVGLIKLKNTAIEVGDALIQAQVQLDKLNNGFKFGAGGAAGGARELAFVREEANRLGLELGGASTQYMKLVASSRGTAMEGEKTRKVFTGLSEAITVMGLSGEQADRAMNAVVQMLSKGKVSAEELRSQFSEHIPGSMAVAARAMGVTEAELNKLMETGQLMSADFLPKFAAQWSQELAPSVEDATKSMQASLNRYETAWLTFKQNVAQTGVSDAIGGQINILSDAFNGVSERMEAARKAGGGFWSQTAAGAGGVAAFLNPINALSYSAISLQGQLEQAKTKLNELEKERPYSENVFLGPAIEETRQLIAELERAKAARDQLARQPGTGASEVRYSAMVDDAALASQREKAKAYAEFWEKNAGPQAQFAAAVIAAKKAMGEFFTPETEANIRERLIKPTREAKKEIDDLTKAAVRGEKLFGDLSATEGGLSGDFAEKWGDLSAAYAKTYINAEQLLAAQAALLKLQPFYKKGLQDEADALKEQAKANAEAAKVEQARIDAAEKSAASVVGKLQALQDEEKALVIAAAQHISLAQAIEEVEIARLREHQAAILRGGDPMRTPEVLAIQEEIEARKKIKAAIGAKEGREAADKTAKEAAEAWKKASEQIEKDITDALMRGFESGKGFAQVMRDTVANMFKTLVLRPVVQAIVSPVAGALTGALGFAGTANAASAIGGIGNLTGIGASLFGNSLAYGAALGTTSVGVGSQAAMLAAQTGGFGSYGLAATAQAAGGAASTIMSAIPYIGAFVAVAALIKSLDNSGTLHAGGASSYSALAGGSAINPMSIGTASVVNNAQTQAMTNGMVKSIVDILDSTAKTFGQEAGYQASTAFADDVSKDSSWGALVIEKGGQTLVNWAADQISRWAPKEFADGKAGAEQYATAVSVAVRDILIQQTPEWADTMLSALGEAPTIEQLGAVVAQINATQSALITMGKASEAFAGLSEAATSALIAAMGGAGAAVENLGGYYANFYSESERAAIETASLTESFAAMGAAMPSTREGLREMIDTALEMGDSQLAAGLINVSNRFAALVPAADSAAKAIDKAADGFYTFALFAPGGTTGTGGGNGINGPMFPGSGGAVAPVSAMQVSDSRAMMMVAAEAASASQAGPITTAFAGIGANLGDKLQGILAALTEQGIKIEDSPFLSGLRDIEGQLYDTLQGVGGSISNAGRNDAAWEKWEQWQRAQKTPGYDKATDPFFQQYGFVDRNTNNAAGSYGDLADFMSFIMGRAGDWRNLVEIQDGAGRGTGSYRDPTQGEYGAIISADMYAFLKAQDTYAEALAELSKQMEEEAKTILDPLKADIAGTQEDPFKRLADQAAEYLKQLDALGQATAENTALVDQWQQVMAQNVRDDLYGQLLTEEERSAAELKKLTDQFAGLNVTMPDSAEAFKTLLDGIDATTPAGRALYDSLLQLIPGFQSVIDIADAAAEALTQTQRDDLYGQLLSQEERAAIELKKLEDQFTGLNVTIPESADAFRALLDGIDATTPAGQALYDALLQLIPEFQKLTDTTAAQAAILSEREGLEMRLLQLQGNTEEIRRRELATLDESNRALQLQIWALEDLQSAAKESAAAVQQTSLAFDAAASSFGQNFSDLSKAYIENTASRDKAIADAVAAYDSALRDSQKQALQKPMQALQDRVSEYTSIKDALFDFVKELRRPAGDDARGLAALQGEFFATVAKARGGDIEAMKLVQEQGQAYLDAAENQSVDYSGFLSAQDLVASAAEDVANMAGAKVSVDQLQLDTLQSQLDALNSIDDAVTKLAELQDAVNAAKAVPVPRTPTDLKSEAAKLVLDGLTGGLGSLEGNDKLRTAADMLGLLDKTNQTFQLGDILRALSVSPELLPADTSGWAAYMRERFKALALPGFASGTNLVPYDMTARIHEGEAVIPARFNPFNPNASAPGNAELVAEVKALREQVTSLLAQGNQNTRRTADLVDDVTEGGNAIRTDVVASIPVPVA